MNNYREYLRGASRPTSGYDKLIQAATGCAADEIGGVERVMRDFYPTLDHLSAAQFKRAARTAYKTWLALVANLSN